MRWLLLLLLAQVMGPSSPAAAASLSVAVPAACLDAAELTALVELDIGTPLDAAVPLRFEVSAEKRAGGYDARLDVFADGGVVARRRRFEAADCATLQATLAVAMTLALSADAAAAVLPSETPEEPETSSTAEPASMRDAAPREALPARTTEAPDLTWIPSFSAGLLIDTGTLPEASLGAAVGAALRIGRLQLQALGTLLFDRDVSLGGQPSSSAAATLGFAGAGLLACTPLFQQIRGPLSSHACLGWELGQLTGEGRGVARARRGRVLWSAPRFDVAGRLALGGTPWGLGLALAAEAPLNRDDFTLGADTIVHRPPTVVGRAALHIDLAIE
jgi:hypothetical protein